MDPISQQSLLAAGSGGATSHSLAVAIKFSNQPFRVYPVDDNGFGTAYSNPSTMLQQTAYWVEWHPDGDVVAFYQQGNISIYPWNAATGFGTKYAAQSDSFSNGFFYRFAWARDGDHIVHVYDSSSYRNFAAYPFSKSTGIGTKLSDPSGSVQYCQGAAFNHAGNVFFTTGYNHSGSKNAVLAYAWNNGFGSLFSNHSTNFSSVPSQISVHPDDNAVAIAVNETSRALRALRWDNSSGWGSQFSVPSHGVSGKGHDVAFSTSGEDVAVAIRASVPVEVFPWTYSGGFGTRYSNPSSYTNNEGNGVAFSNDDAYIAVGHNSSPRISAWPWTPHSSGGSNGGFGTRFSNPSTLPNDDGFGVRFNP
jgi:hypothetical protein